MNFPFNAPVSSSTSHCQVLNFSRGKKGGYGWNQEIALSDMVFGDASELNDEFWTKNTQKNQDTQSISKYP